jgi:hypothetical protein
MWRQWYPRETTIAFLTPGINEQGTAKEEIRATTSAQGEKHSEVNVAVALPNRAYDDYLSTLVWLLGVLEVHARGRDLSGPSASAWGGQGTGVSSILEYLRHLDIEKENPAIRHLSELGVNWKRLPGNIPDVPSMFLNAQSETSVAPATASTTSKTTSTSPLGDARRAVPRPSIVAQFPADLGLGPLDAPAQAMTQDVVSLINLYLSKPEAKRDKAAEQFRLILEPITNLYIYRNKNEAINLKQGVKSNMFVGVPTQDVTYPAIFVELLRVLEMQDERLTSSWERRQDIAGSIRKFLDTYAKENPGDSAISQLGGLDIKTLTELW